LKFNVVSTCDYYLLQGPSLKKLVATHKSNEGLYILGETLAEKLSLEGFNACTVVFLWLMRIRFSQLLICLVKDMSYVATHENISLY